MRDVLDEGEVGGRTAGARSVVLAGVLTLWACSPGTASAGPLEKFAALEARMAEAQDAFVAADEGHEHHAHPAHSTERAKTANDPRLDILRKLDALALANQDNRDGAEIASGAFFWSWNLDLDLPSLHSRFGRLVEHFPSDPALDDALAVAHHAALATDKIDVWAQMLGKLAQTTQRKETRFAAFMSLGQLQLGADRPSQARATFRKVVKSEAQVDIKEIAKGYIHEIDHLQVSMAAPDFTTRTLDGKTVTLKSLRGKVVLLDFWATWCAPCISETPYLKAAAARFKGQPFEILAVSLDDLRSDLADMVKGADLPGIQTWEGAQWDDHPVRRLYNVQSVPTWYLLDKQGVIRSRDPFGDKLIPAVDAQLGVGNTRRNAG